MKSLKLYIPSVTVILSLILLTSCEDVIDVDVPNAGARLVVDASIAWEKNTTGETQSITLRQSTAFFDSNPDVPATGAFVTVTKNNDGSVFVFTDQNNGNYITTNFVPEINTSYTLNIDYNGNSYSATETLIAVPEINRIEQTIEGGVDEEEIQLKVFFDDPVGLGNYYFSEFYPDNLPIPTLAVLDDEFTDGNENFIEFDNESLVTGVSVGVNLHGISEQYFDYISLLLQNNDADGPFVTTPAQLRGNCFNVNDSNEEVLGYFRLGEVDRTTYIIE